MSCVHDDLDRLTCEPEGYENPTEPLQIRITCGLCGKYLTIIINDVPFREWMDD